MYNSIKGLSLWHALLYAFVLLMCNLSIAKENKFIELNSLWDGSEIRVQATHSGSEIIFTISNLGSDMDVARSYEIIEDDLNFSQGNFNLNLANGNEVTVSIPANEGIYTLNAEQHPDHPNEEFASATIEIFNSKIASSNSTDSFLDTATEYIEEPNDLNEEIEFQFSPNPFSAHLQVSANKNEFINQSYKNDYTLNIYNAQGVLLIEQDLIDVSTEISTQKLVPGMYFYRIFSEEYIIDTGQLLKN